MNLQGGVRVQIQLKRMSEMFEWNLRNFLKHLNGRGRWNTKQTSLRSFLGRAWCMSVMGVPHNHYTEREKGNHDLENWNDVEPHKLSLRQI